MTFKSSEGDERQVQSIPDQFVALRRIAERDNLTIHVELSEERSAKAPKTRPVFSDLVTRIENGEIDAILCWHINRLFRNPADGGIIRWLIQNGKIQCIRTSDRLYLPEDNSLILAVEEGMATQYVRDLSKDVKRGLHSKAQRGWQPGLAPPGYLNLIEDVEGARATVIRPDPERFDLIRRAFDHMLTGAYTVPRLLTQLNGWGYRSRLTKSGGGKPISRSKLYFLLKNPFYYGVFNYGGELHVGNHKPMITKEEFDKVQDLVKRRERYRPQKHERPFTGWMRCGRCGCLVTAEQKVRIYRTVDRQGIFTYYHCTGWGGCPRLSLREEAIEQEIVRILSQFTIRPDKASCWAKVVGCRSFQAMDDAEERRISTSRQTQERIQQRLDRLYDMRADGEITAGEFSERKKTYESSLSSLAGQERAAKAGDILVRENWNNALDYAQRAYLVFDQGSTLGRRTIAQMLGNSATLRDRRLKISVSPFLDVFRTFEPPKGVEHMVENDIWRSLSPGLLGKLNHIRTEIILGRLTFGKLPPTDILIAK
jgi:DNA invertase Pin-like site-specific DNA recombinase